MDIEKVKLMYERISEDTNLISIAGCIFWALILLVTIYEFIKNKKSGSAILGYSLSILIMFSILGALIFSIVQSKDSITEQEWKTDYLQPYVKTKPVNKIEIDDIQQVLDKPKNLTNSVFLTNKDSKYYFKITYKNKRSIFISANVKNSKSNQNYITFKKINTKISKKYNQNTYFDPVIYVQKGFIPVYD